MLSCISAEYINNFLNQDTYCIGFTYPMALLMARLVSPYWLHYPSFISAFCQAVNSNDVNKLQLKNITILYIAFYK